MRTGLKAIQVLFVLSSFLPLSASARDSCRLTREVSRFDAPRQSRLSSLRDFARQNRLSFGIESVSSLDKQASISAPSGTVLTIVKAIVGPIAKTIECFEGVILVRDQNAPSPKWLNTRVPEFRLNRSRLGLANAALWMRVEVVLNPAQTSFAGDILGDLGEYVGPFDAKRATVRALLCHLAASSPGTIWISGDIQPFGSTAWTNRLWTLVPSEATTHQ